MSWYSNPIQPIDPVVVSQQPKPPIRYMRDNFAGTGQHSYVQAPAQDQSQWQSLINVQPITQGILNQRWGYNKFAGNFNAANRLSNFQSDSFGTRSIIAAGPSNVAALTENGSSYNPNIFTPVAPNAVIRSVTSRNFQYFCDGVNSLDPSTHLTGDSLKWNGAAVGGTTNTGILSSDVTSNVIGGGGSGNTVGPSTGTTAVDAPLPNPNPWTNPSGAFSNNISTAAFCNVFETITAVFVGPRAHDYAYTYSNNNTVSDTLQLTGFFSNAIGAGVAGLQTSIRYKVTLSGASSMVTGTATAVVQLIKNGAPTGIAKKATLFTDGNLHTINLGSASDLWGSSFTTGDLVASNFGFQIYIVSSFTPIPSSGFSGTPNYFVQVPEVTMTASLSGSSGSSSTSGAGVGVVSGGSGGNITLVLGRTYYLVANNSLTGHFSDLSIASTNTGPLNNAVVNLILAGYNDPQVDTKYVLATADGGDPSILYEVQVLAPGLNITSWSINGSNVVTFSGNYSTAQFTTGQHVTIGGLVHGSYLNGVTLTVTSSTSNSFSASFTHGADSATEQGVAGNLTFAIPNSAVMVVDNTPDPTLVTYQPLLFTDQFGVTYGVALNSPPPAGSLITKHQGRLWMAGVPGSTHSVYFSKSTGELTLPNGFIAGKYEEAWPGSNYFDVSDGAESVAGLLSDGTTLYIGTQNHIRRLLGNAPSNFQQPQIVHPGVGLINQEVWQLVFMQGSPSGSIWMTPDFRVIQSDFNTYVDIGSPIQDILNNLQPTAQSLAHGQFVADGEFDLYILAVPYLQSTYCDTHLVFDLRARQWFVWQPAGGSLSLLYNVTQAGLPQWLFISGTGSNATYTAPLVAGITVTAQHGRILAQGATNTATAPFVTGSTITISGTSVSQLNGSFVLIGAISLFGTSGFTFLSPVGPQTSSGGTLTFNYFNGSINIYQASAVTDNGTTIPVSATTTWMHLGEPTRRKVLNEVQVFGNTGMTMSIYGSNNLSDFIGTPRPIVYNRTLKQSPFFTWNLYLTGARSRHRYYQFSFNASNGLVPFLGSYAIASTALEDL